MDVSIILQKIRQRGLVITPIGNNISLTPKNLLDDRMISFLRKHKELLLTALYQEQNEQQALHRKRKLALQQGRVHVLRILLWRFLQNGKCRQMINHQENSEINDKSVEVYFDGELVNFDYDIEVIIDMYRIYTPESAVVDKFCSCGYVPPFCSCFT